MDDAAVKRRIAALPGRLLRRLRADLVRRRPQPTILMYHRIASDRFDPWGLCVSPRRFRAQMQWLARRRTVLTVPEFVRLQAAGRLPQNAVAVTFDDGYACAAQVAAPILRDMNIPATVFVSPELIDKQQEFWWDELTRIVLDFPGEALVAAGERYQLGRRRRADRIWRAGEPPRSQRQKAFSHIWSRLRTLAPDELSSARTQMRAQAEFDGAPRESHRPMTRAETRALAAGGIEVGSHALTHSSLPRLTADAKAREMRESFERCTSLTGREPFGIAYPFGDHDVETERMAEQAGYGCGCTTEQRPVTSESATFALPRVAVGDWDPGQLRRALALL